MGMRILHISSSILSLFLAFLYKLLNTVAELSKAFTSGMYSKMLHLFATIKVNILACSCEMTLIMESF